MIYVMNINIYIYLTIYICKQNSYRTVDGDVNGPNTLIIVKYFLNILISRLRIMLKFSRLHSQGMSDGHLTVEEFDLCDLSC